MLTNIQDLAGHRLRKHSSELGKLSVKSNDLAIVVSEVVQDLQNAQVMLQDQRSLQKLQFQEQQEAAYSLINATREARIGVLSTGILAFNWMPWILSATSHYHYCEQKILIDITDLLAADGNAIVLTSPQH